jgi:hypothetical protein
LEIIDDSFKIDELDKVREGINQETQKTKQELRSQPDEVEFRKRTAESKMQSLVLEHGIETIRASEQLQNEIKSITADATREADPQELVRLLEQRLAQLTERIEAEYAIPMAPLEDKSHYTTAKRLVLPLGRLVSSGLANRQNILEVTEAAFSFEQERGSTTSVRLPRGYRRQQVPVTHSGLMKILDIARSRADKPTSIWG